MKLLKNNEARVWFCEHIYILSNLAILILAFGATVIVYQSAWLSDDGFITLRYVNNTINGYGAVFNVGEFVQGYTHPLWYLVLLIGTWIFKNEILTAIAISLILTFLTLSIFGLILLKHAVNYLASLIVFILAISIFISSDIWVSFQTGGLENSLANLLILLIIYESYFLKLKRPILLLFLISLLCLTRPDYVIFCAPFGILIFAKLRSIRTIGLSFFAVTPSLIWLLFAWRYYGSPLPNTGIAKLGIFPVEWAILYGVFYFSDWCIKDFPTSAITILTLYHCTVVSRKDNYIRIILLAITLHICWVIYIGGDFMRGRFFMPVLTASIVIGAFEVLTRLNNKPAPNLSKILLLSICFLTGAFFISQKNLVNEDAEWNRFVVNERRFYPGYALKNYLSTKYIENSNFDLTFASDLQIYANICGPITVHYYSPGTIGYFAGPQVTVIDILGLTDKYIAKLPRTFLIQPIHSRPGHPAKYVPVSYLAKRGDIRLLPNWEAGIKERDCSLITQVAPLTQSMKYWGTQGIVDDLPVK